MPRRVQAFCAIKLAAVFDETVKETSCSLCTTVRFWCLLRIFTFHFIGEGSIVRTWGLWRAQYDRYKTDFWILCCLGEKNWNVSKVHLQNACLFHDESHSVSKCFGGMNVKLESVTKCSNLSCEDPFWDGHVHLPYYIAVVFQTVS